MKHIPILFSTAMVQAILEGRKTQTRRVVKKAIGFNNEFVPTPIKEEHISGVKMWEMRSGPYYHLPWFKCPYGQPGDVLWVRESFCKMPEADSFGQYLYKAANDIPYGAWKPSIHMPKSACRLFLKVKSVRVERLHDISDDDCFKEGIQTIANKPNNDDGTARGVFKSLWKFINGTESWYANPWVWVVEFERCDMPEGFLN